MQSQLRPLEVHFHPLGSKTPSVDKGTAQGSRFPAHTRGFLMYMTRTRTRPGTREKLVQLVLVLLHRTLTARVGGHCGRRAKHARASGRAQSEERCGWLHGKRGGERCRAVRVRGDEMADRTQDRLRLMRRLETGDERREQDGKETETGGGEGRR